MCENLGEPGEMFFFSLLFASCWSSAGAYGLRQKENPIRRIVTLLQDMQKEIETEGDTQGQKRVCIRARESYSFSDRFGKLLY